MTPGIYRLLNTVTWMSYVGSSRRCVRNRRNNHLSKLRRGCHDNGFLQAAFNKYGEEAFRFEVLEVGAPEALDAVLAREQFWIDMLRASDREYGYNFLPVAGSPLGVPASAARRAKNGASHKGKKVSPETRAKMRAAALGRVISEEQRAKASAITAALWADPSHRARMATAQQSDRAIASRAQTNLGNAARLKGQKGFFTGQTHTAETRAKMSVAARGRPAWNKGITLAADSPTRQKQSLAAKARAPETRLSQAAAVKAKWQDPDFRKKMKSPRKTSTEGNK